MTESIARAPEQAIDLLTRLLETVDRGMTLIEQHAPAAELELIYRALRDIPARLVEARIEPTAELLLATRRQTERETIARFLADQARGRHLHLAVSG